ncbi:MAG: response regulator [Candidatus Velthaea sp.]
MQVVIVDDVAAETRLIASAIRRLPDVEPVCFTSPVEALAWAHTNDPAVVVFDYNMPTMDGLEFFGRLRNMRGKEHVPVIMVTADADLGIRLRALEMGADDFLMKPYRTAEVRECVWKLLDEQRLQRIRERQEELLVALAFDDRSHLEDFEGEAEELQAI